MLDNGGHCKGAVFQHKANQGQIKCMEENGRIKHFSITLYETQNYESFIYSSDIYKVVKIQGRRQVNTDTIDKKKSV